MKGRDNGDLPPRARRVVEAIVDAAIARGKGTAADRDRLLEEAVQEVRHVSRLQAESVKLIHRQRRTMADQACRLVALEKQVHDLKALLERRERRLKNASETILNYDGEIERLTAQIRADAELIESLRDGRSARKARRDRGSDQADGAAPPPRAAAADAGGTSPRSGFHPMSRQPGRP